MYIEETVLAYNQLKLNTKQAFVRKR